MSDDVRPEGMESEESASSDGDPAGRQARVEAAATARTLRAERLRAERRAEVESENRAKREAILQTLPDQDYLESASERLAESRRQRHRRTMRRFQYFVLMPTLLYFCYSALIATSFYEAESVFTVKTSDGRDPNAVGAANAGLLFSNPFQDAFMVREHLLSRELMTKMDAEHGFLAHYTENWQERLWLRFGKRFLGRDELDFYRGRVRVGVDTQEGILRLHVRALRPEQARLFSVALLDYAEDKVNRLSEQILDDQVRLLEREVTVAKEGFNAARQDLIDLQENFEYATVERDLARRKWEAAIDSLEEGRRNVLAQRRYFYIVVAPSSAADPSYPRTFSSTFVFFVLIGTLYWVANVFSTSMKAHGRL